jgi:WD40 repeat protein
MKKLAAPTLHGQIQWVRRFCSAVVLLTALASAGLRTTRASDKPTRADGKQPSAGAPDQTTDKNPSHPAAAVTVKELVAAAGALPPPRKDLPGHASVQLGDLRFRTEASDLAFLPDGKTIVSASWDDGIKWWDIGSGKVKRRMRVEAGKMLMFADRQRLVTQDPYDRQHNSLQIWNAADGNHVANVKWPLGNPLDFKLLALTPDGTAAILSGPDDQIVLRELATGRVLKQRNLSSSRIGGVAISPNGGLLAIDTFSNQLFLWEWRSATPPVELGPGQRYAGLAFSADGKHLAAGGDSQDEVRIFNVATHAIERRLTDPKGRPLLVDDLTFTPDGKRLAAANSILLTDGFTAGILVWDVETGALKQRLTVSGARPTRLALSADGNLLAAPMGETLHVWNLQTGRTVGGETTGHTDAVRAVCFSPKPERIVTASDDGTARIWDAVTGRELHRLEHGGKLVRAAAVSPDGTLAATSGLDDKVCLWQMETGKQVHALQGHGVVGEWRALQFSPDGSLLDSWGDDKKLRVWEVATGKLKRAFALTRSGSHDADPVHERTRTLLPRDPEIEDICSGACFQNGGSRLVLTGRNHFWIFDTATGREIVYGWTPVPISVLACAESGNQILLGSTAPFRWRRLSSGAWTSEAVGSGSLRLMAGESGRPPWSTTVNGIYVGPIALSPNGRLAAAGIGGAERTSIGIFDGKTGSLLRTIEGVERMQGGLREAAFSPDGKRLAVAQRDGTVLIWDLARMGVK